MASSQRRPTPDVHRQSLFVHLTRTVEHLLSLAEHRDISAREVEQARLSQQRWVQPRARRQPLAALQPWLWRSPLSASSLGWLRSELGWSCRQLWSELPALLQEGGEVAVPGLGLLASQLPLSVLLQCCQQGSMAWLGQLQREVPALVAPSVA